MPPHDFRPAAKAPDRAAMARAKAGAMAQNAPRRPLARCHSPRTLPRASLPAWREGVGFRRGVGWSPLAFRARMSALRRARGGPGGGPDRGGGGKGGQEVGGDAADVVVVAVVAEREHVGDGAGREYGAAPGGLEEHHV